MEETGPLPWLVTNIQKETTLGLYPITNAKNGFYWNWKIKKLNIM